MCTKLECKSIAKSVDNVSIYEGLKQLDMCEKCSYNKKVEKYKYDTYRKFRLKMIKHYWIDPSKYTEAQRLLGGRNV